jgi:hypothetical protein
LTSNKITDGLLFLGIAIIGFVHEFVISEQKDALPVILFGLIGIRGLARLFEKK